MDGDLDREVVVNDLLSSNRFEEAEAFAVTVKSEWEQAESLSHIARAAWKASDPENARRLWSIALEVARRGERSESSQDSLDSSSVLGEIAENLAVIGAFEEARNTALAIQDQRKKEDAIRSVEAIFDGRAGSFHF